MWFTTLETLTCKFQNRLWNNYQYLRIVHKDHQWDFSLKCNISLFPPRICLLGNKLLASSSYHECSRNDSLLNSTYGDETFWKDNPLSYVVGVPGITSGVFDGNLISQSIQSYCLLQYKFMNTKKFNLILFRIKKGCLEVNANTKMPLKTNYN